MNESSKLIFQLLALKKTGNRQKAEKLLRSTLNKFPENSYLRWVASAFHRDGNEKIIKLEILNNQEVVRPYDPVFVDSEFEMITDLFYSLAK